MLADVLTRASDLRRRTGGLVDVGVGGDVIAWGYDRSFEQVPRRVVGSPLSTPAGHWDIDGDILTRTPGTRLDLGGVGKGWTCDLAVERGHALMVSAGGDIRSAIDTATVDVTDPTGAVIADVRLGHGALASSSTARRRWVLARPDGSDVAAHHIIDPRTGAPAGGAVLSATVVAATAIEAEAGAKAVLIGGATGLAWADEQPWIDGALVVWHDGAVYATTGMELAA